MNVGAEGTVVARSVSDEAISNYNNYNIKLDLAEDNFIKGEKMNFGLIKSYSFF